jgi:hypothetical protein
MDQFLEAARVEIITENPSLVDQIENKRGIFMVKSASVMAVPLQAKQSSTVYLAFYITCLVLLTNHQGSQIFLTVLNMVQNHRPAVKNFLNGNVQGVLKKGCPNYNFTSWVGPKMI